MSKMVCSTFEAHHDLFDGTVERPVVAPIDPETVTAEKHGTAEGALGNVVAGVDADDVFGGSRRADEHVFVHDVEIVVGGVILVVGETVERDARHVDARSVDDAFIVGGSGGEITFVVRRIAQNIIGDAVEEMIVLTCVMPRNLILIARHLHEDTAAQIRDERLVVREPGDGADGLGSKPKADAHRASGKRILRESPRQLDGADHARAIVVGLHGVTGMRLHKELARFGVGSALRMDNCCGNFESLLGIGDEFAVDDRMIFLVAWEFVEGILRQTESPVTFVVFENPRHGMRTFLVEIQMRLEFFKAQHFIGRQRIRNDVKRIVLEVHDAFAVFRFEIRLMDNIPLRHFPRPDGS